jgi:hypothetical protein
MASADLSNYGWILAPSVTTDGDGRFHFDQLSPGDYELDAETLHDGRTAKRVVAAGTDDAVLTLARPTCVSGATLDPSHKPASPIVWDDRIELVGWDLPATARVGEPTTVALVFRVRAPIVHAWELFAHFDGADDRRQIGDHVPVSETCPTSTWKVGDVLVDRFSTTLPVAEAFTLRIGFFRYGEGDAPFQNLVGPSGTDGGRTDGVELGTITVAPAPAP